MTPYDTLKQGAKIFAELLSHTCDSRYLCCLLFWALYLTLPATTFKDPSVSIGSMTVSDNKLACATLNPYDCSNATAKGQTFSLGVPAAQG